MAEDHRGEPLVVVAGVIVDSFDDPRRLLVSRRSGPAPVAGLWEFPGGKLEEGETPEDALRRELREELGVDVEVGSAFEPSGPVAPATLPAKSLEGYRAWDLGRLSSGRPGALLMWWCRVVAGEPEAREGQLAVQWHGLDDQLPSLPWIPANGVIVEHLLVRAAARR